MLTCSLAKHSLIDLCKATGSQKGFITEKWRPSEPSCFSTQSTSLHLFLIYNFNKRYFRNDFHSRLSMAKNCRSREMLKTPCFSHVCTNSSYLISHSLNRVCYTLNNIVPVSCIMNLIIPRRRKDFFQGVGKGFPRWPIVVEFHLDNSETKRKTFSNKKLKAKH